MIIKSQRVATSGSLKRLLDHVFRGEENDAIAVLQGGELDVKDAWRDARQHGAQHAIRHWQLCPADTITREQAYGALAALATEYGFTASRATLVEHAKPRASEAHDRHWHVLLSEVDPATGRILSSSHDFARHEYLARVLEHRWEHAFVLGRHTKAVLARMRREGLSAVAEALDAALKPGIGCEPPREAFTTERHRTAKRSGIDLPAAKVMVARAWTTCTSLRTLTKSLADARLDLSAGDVPGEWIVAADGTLLGSLLRLTRT